MPLFVSSFFPRCECSALLQFKCASRRPTLCSQYWNISLHPSGFQSGSLLFLLCVAKSGPWKSPSPSCRACAVLQAGPKHTLTWPQVSKAGSDPWDYSLARGWGRWGNFYKGCEKGVESQDYSGAGSQDLGLATWLFSSVRLKSQPWTSYELWCF